MLSDAETVKKIFDIADQITRSNAPLTVFLLILSVYVGYQLISIARKNRARDHNREVTLAKKIDDYEQAIHSRLMDCERKHQEADVRSTLERKHCDEKIEKLNGDLVKILNEVSGLRMAVVLLKGRRGVPGINAAPNDGQAIG